MKKINSFRNLSKSDFNSFRSAITTELEELGKKYGVDIKAGHISYTDKNCVVKLEVACLDASGTALTQESEDFKALATMYGLQPSDLGKKIFTRGEEFTIEGLMRKSHKYPILLRNSRGQGLKMTADSVKIALMMAEKKK